MNKLIAALALGYLGYRFGAKPWYYIQYYAPGGLNPNVYTGPYLGDHDHIEFRLSQNDAYYAELRRKMGE
jgi:hypothetical protein